MADLQLIYNDKIFYKQIYVKNKNTSKANGVKVKFNYDSGVEYNNHSTQKGTFDGTVWDIGELLGGETVSLNLHVIINDYTRQPLYVLWNVTSNEFDLNPTDNYGKWKIEYITCEETKSCVEEIIPDPQTLLYDPESNQIAITEGNAVTLNKLTKEEVQDYASVLLNHLNHVNITATYDDVNNKIVLTGSPDLSLSQEEVQDYISPLLNHSNHTNITATYDDVNNEILLTATQIPQLTQEEVQDYAAPLLNHANHTNITATYDDIANEIVLEASGVGGGLTQEEVQDFAAPLLDHANHIGATVSYNDAANQIIITASGTGITQEEVEDIVANLIVDGANITSTYDDVAGTYTISVTGLTPSDVGLGNVPNVDATLRSNHTGTQTASTISDFDTEVSNNASVVVNTAKVSFPEAPADGTPYSRQDNGWVASPTTDITGITENLVIAPIMSVNTWVDVLDTGSISSGVYYVSAQASVFGSTSATVHFRIITNVDGTIAPISECTIEDIGKTKVINISGIGKMIAAGNIKFQVYSTDITGFTFIITTPSSIADVTKMSLLKIS